MKNLFVYYLFKMKEARFTHGNTKNGDFQFYRPVFFFQKTVFDKLMVLIIHIYRQKSGKTNDYYFASFFFQKISMVQYQEKLMTNKRTDKQGLIYRTSR